MRRVRALAFGALLLSALACDSLPGKPAEADRYVHPADVMDFDALYALNCSGCHGENGRLGPARALNDPLYLALVPPAELKRIIEKGVEGTPMPAFAQSAGGSLTQAQVDALVSGLRESFGAEISGSLPPYRGSARGGNASRGRVAFGTFCGDCHGVDGRGSDKAGSVVDSSFLGLVSDQSLRTSVIVGRPDLEMPSWRDYVPGRAMTEREIADVVAWLVAQRPEYPGQPHPPASAASEGGS